MTGNRRAKYKLVSTFPIAVMLVFAGSSSGAVRSLHPGPGTKIVHFDRVDSGVYKGSSPRSDADYRFLRSKHIRYIVDLEFLPVMHNIEKAKAARYGIVVIPALMNGSPVPPSEKHVNRILALLRDPNLHPIYFHCALGRDRTSLIAGLYKMYFQGMSQRQAWRYMRASGFKDSWTLRGLKTYFEKHPVRPPELARR